MEIFTELLFLDTVYRRYFNDSVQLFSCFYILILEEGYFAHTWFVKIDDPYLRPAVELPYCVQVKFEHVAIVEVVRDTRGVLLVLVLLVEMEVVTIEMILLLMILLMMVTTLMITATCVTSSIELIVLHASLLLVILNALDTLPIVNLSFLCVN